MIKIHHARRSRSVRILWLLEELGVPYELAPMEFTPEALKHPEYMKVHPLGQVPAIEIDGFTMIESGAIVEYLLERFGQGRLAPPVATLARATYLQWFHYGEATLTRHISEIIRNRFGMPESSRCPEFIPFARARYREALGVVDGALASQPFIAGNEFSAADIMITYAIVMAKITRELPEDFKNVAAYLARLKDRPGYVTAWA